MLNFFSKIFLKITGWKPYGDIPPEFRQKCVVIAVPHTSNWDLPYCVTLMSVIGIKMRYTIKKSWMFFPMNILLKGLGAIPIDRSPKREGEARKSMVEAMVDLFNQNEKLALVIPPEGTRGLRTEWKTGFYHVALQANVPIVLGFLDYKNKIGGALGVVHPTGDMEKDMREIMKVYRSDMAKFPEKFSVDVRYK